MKPVLFFFFVTVLYCLKLLKPGRIIFFATLFLLNANVLMYVHTLIFIYLSSWLFRIVRRVRSAAPGDACDNFILRPVPRVPLNTAYMTNRVCYSSPKWQ
jgi:hypothetical protein